MPVGAGARNELELPLRADNAVVILDLVGQLQAVAGVLRIFRERDGRCAVGDRGEMPRHIVGGAHRDAAVAIDGETPFGRAAFCGRLLGRFGLGQAALDRHIEIDPAAGADDEDAAGRHCDRIACGRRGLASPQTLQDHGGPAGIGRRADPGVDAEIHRRDRTPPIEGEREATRAVVAGDEEGGDQHHQHERA
jgi:hypothetical protein